MTSDDLTAARQMLAVQIHRGPDGEGLVAVGEMSDELTELLPTTSRVSLAHVSSSVVLGHRRLAIIDLSDAGRQPLSNEDGTVWLTYNGEVYNYRALREDLVHAGHRFTSHTDSEVVVHGYEEWGIEGLLARLCGMFAFALYDARNDRSKGRAQTTRLILARDRFGIKPLYYSHYAEGLLFASEVRALLAAGVISDETDPHAVMRFLQLGSVPVPLTTAKYVRALPAGQYLVADHEDTKLCSYWRLSEVLTRASEPSVCQSEAVVINETRTLLDEAIGSHLLSDVPLGAFLSGGIDSSSLVALAARRQQSPLATLSVSFFEAAYDESPYAQRVAAQYHTIHRELLLHSTECFSALPDIMEAMDQPSADGVNTYFVAKAARQLGLTVALSGIGGDEVFLGYDHLKHTPLWGSALTMLRQLPRWARHTVLATGARVGVSLGQAGAEKLHYLTIPSDEHLYLLLRGLFTRRQIQDLLGIGEHEVTDIAPLSPLESSDTSQPLGVTLALLEFHVYLQSQLLRDADCMGMAHGLEIRVPFLDHHLVEYVLGLPLTLKRCRGMNKPLLVRALGEALPRSVWDRPKQGFTFPFAQWLRQHEEEFRVRTKESQIFVKPAVENVWRDFYAGRLHWSRPWALLVLSHFTARERQSQGSGWGRRIGVV
jgi:asparagine synthase (glutamine-hydrolysing)